MAIRGPQDEDSVVRVLRRLRISWPCIRTLLGGLIAAMPIGLAPTASPAAEEVIRVAVGEWAPYFSENADGYGTFAKVVTRAFELEGYRVEFGFFPWNRALLETKEGRWPVSAGWGMTRERQPFFYFCDPVLVEREQFFYSTDRPVSAKSWDDFAGLSLGIIEGAAVGEAVTQLIEEGKVTVFRQGTFQDLFTMLKVGRVDLVMGNEFVAADAIAQTFSPEEAKKYQALRDVAVEWDYRVIVSKKLENGEKLCGHFNRGLRLLQQNGEYERLLFPQRSGLPSQDGSAS